MTKREYNQAAKRLAKQAAEKVLQIKMVMNKMTILEAGSNGEIIDYVNFSYEDKEYQAYNKDEKISCEEVSEDNNTLELPTLTKNEISLLNAMRDNEFEDALISCQTWTFAAIQNSGLTDKQAKGVIASLIKKDLVIVCNWDENDTIISFTKLGERLFDNADGGKCQWGGKKLLKTQNTPEDITKEEAKFVTLKAFTGMIIGTFEVHKISSKFVEVKTKQGSVLKFDKKTLKQVNGNNPKFANKIELV